MAHNLAVNEKTGKAAFFGIEPAWHGLGLTLENPATAKEAIEYAGLDFDVLQRPVQVNVGTDENPHYITVPNKVVNYRSDNNAPLGVVGNVYRPLQNTEAFSFFDTLVDAEDAIYHTAGALGNGEKIWVLAKLPQHIKVGKDDIIEQYVLIYNSHDGSSGITACLTPIRVVCNNTLTAALSGAKNKVSIRHTVNSQARLSQAHQLMDISNLYAQEMEDIFNQMAKKKINEKMVNQFLDTIYPINPDNEARTAAIKIREGILESMEIGVGQDLKTTKGTVFGLYNAMTFYTDHVKEFKTSDSKLKSIWFGGTASKRQEAFDAATLLLN